MKKSAFVAVLAVAAVASADTIVNVDYVGPGAGRNLRITGPGSTGPTQLHVFAGQLNHSITGPVWWAGTQATFCVEVAQTVSDTASDYTVKSLGQVPGSPQPLPGQTGTGMGTDRAKALAHLYDAANGAQFGTNRDYAAAFQVAVWELTFDFNDSDSSSINLGSGYFKLDSAGSGTSGDQYNAIVSHAGQWLNYVLANFSTDARTSLVGLHSSSKQDQVVLVPLPAPVALGLAGLVGVGVIRRFRPR